KSTLLWHVLNEGARLITDDVLPMYVNGKDILGIPSISIRPKLWVEELEGYCMDHSLTEEIATIKGKYWVSVSPTNRSFNSGKIHALFLLKPCDNFEKDKVEFSRLSSIELLYELLENTHGLWAVPKEVYSRLLDT